MLIAKAEATLTLKFVSYFNLHKLNLSPLESRLQHYRLQNTGEGSTHVACIVWKAEELRQEMTKKLGECVYWLRENKTFPVIYQTEEAGGF